MYLELKVSEGLCNNNKATNLHGKQGKEVNLRKQRKRSNSTTNDMATFCPQ